MAVFRIEDLSSEMCERLASDNEDLRKKIANLKSEVSLKDKKRDKLKSQNEDLEDKIDVLEDKIDVLESQNENLKDKIRDLKDLVLLWLYSTIFR